MHNVRFQLTRGHVNCQYCTVPVHVQHQGLGQYTTNERAARHVLEPIPQDSCCTQRSPHARPSSATLPAAIVCWALLIPALHWRRAYCHQSHYKGYFTWRQVDRARVDPFLGYRVRVCWRTAQAHAHPRSLICPIRLTSVRIPREQLYIINKYLSSCVHFNLNLLRIRRLYRLLERM